jgi:hypothetical protein
MKLWMVVFLFFSAAAGFSQDTSIHFENRVFTMPVAVIRSNLDVPAFIKYVQQDTSFYKAFKNIKILGFSAINDIRMKDKKETDLATLHSKTVQIRKNGCRETVVQEEEVTGNFYDKNRNYNYYTAEMYASLLFVKKRTCGETNKIGPSGLSTKGLKGIEKHKQQLKMLFFNPGKKINGIPLMGKKTALFDEALSTYYDNLIDFDYYKGQHCYKFCTLARKDLTKTERGNIVIDSMVTWFLQDDLTIVGRNYYLSYKAGVYDFQVRMEVEMTRYRNLTVPSLIRYVGDWDVAFKKRERGIFTAILFDFTD